jgi:hypothetical protein
MIEIRKYGFGEDLNDTDDLSWTGIQFWQVVKQLATTNTVSTLTALAHTLGIYSTQTILLYR